jgi:surface protein
MANVITNDNIRDLVTDYVEDRGRLPEWLQGIPIGDWDVSNVTNMRALFRGLATFNEPLTNWDVSNVTTMERMFEDCDNFNQPLNNWNVSNVREMNMMFFRCDRFNQPLNDWDVSNVMTMSSIFNNCPNFNQPLDNWNVSNVRFMSDMFRNCRLFNQPLNNWNVSSVESMRRMFEGCTIFNQPLDNWDVSNVRDMFCMFRDCTSFNQDLSNWNVSGVESGEMIGMFRGCTSLTINPNWQLDPRRHFERDIFENSGIPGAYRPYRPQPTQQTQRPEPMPPQELPPLIAFAQGRITLDEVIRLSRNNPQQLQQLIAFVRGLNTEEDLIRIARFDQNHMRQPQPAAGPAARLAARPAAGPAGVAYEVHNAFDLDLPKFMSIITRENNGSSNFKDANNILEPIVSYINGPDTALSSEQKTRYMRNIRGSIRQNVNEYIRDHPEVKDNTLEVIQFVLSQEPNYKDLYIETFENECMGGYSTGNRQSCTKGMFERIYMANKGTIEGVCFEELQSGNTRAAAAARATSCKPVYLELYSAFVPGADIDINDIFQKWYNQFSYDAIPEGENPLTNLSVDARKKHFRNFVRQDEIMTRRIWRDRNFQRKLEESIEANNIIFETLNLDAGLGRRKRRRHRRTVKHIFSIIERKKKNQRKTIKKQGHTTMKHLKKNIRKTKAKY